MTTWIDVERPRQLGKERDKRHAQWDIKYGKDNWRLVWKVKNFFFDFLGACALYEDAYFAFLQFHHPMVVQLTDAGSNVYDNELSNIESGLDYTKQESVLTHVQDIAIRRCLVRLGSWFRGAEPIQIRSHDSKFPLSPGLVPFHRPNLIEQPEIVGWWQPGSTESFYQSNRFLQVSS